MTLPLSCGTGFLKASSPLTKRTPHSSLSHLSKPLLYFKISRRFRPSSDSPRPRDILLLVLPAQIWKPARYFTLTTGIEPQVKSASTGLDQRGSPGVLPLQGFLLRKPGTEHADPPRDNEMSPAKGFPANPAAVSFHTGGAQGDASLTDSTNWHLTPYSFRNLIVLSSAL